MNLYWNELSFIRLLSTSLNMVSYTKLNCYISKYSDKNKLSLLFKKKLL